MSILLVKRVLLGILERSVARMCSAPKVFLQSGQSGFGMPFQAWSRRDGGCSRRIHPHRSGYRSWITSSPTLGTSISCGTGGRVFPRSHDGGNATQRGFSEKGTASESRGGWQRRLYCPSWRTRRRQQPGLTPGDAGASGAPVCLDSRRSLNLRGFLLQPLTNGQYASPVFWSLNVRSALIASARCALKRWADTPSRRSRISADWKGISPSSGRWTRTLTRQRS